MLDLHRSIARVDIFHAGTEVLKIRGMWGRTRCQGAVEAVGAAGRVLEGSLRGSTPPAQCQTVGLLPEERLGGILTLCLSGTPAMLGVLGASHLVGYIDFFTV